MIYTNLQLYINIFIFNYKILNSTYINIFNNKFQIKYINNVFCSFSFIISICEFFYK